MTVGELIAKLTGEGGDNEVTIVDFDTGCNWTILDVDSEYIEGDYPKRIVYIHLTDE